MESRSWISATHSPLALHAGHSTQSLESFREELQNPTSVGRARSPCASHFPTDIVIFGHRRAKTRPCKEKWIDPDDIGLFLWDFHGFPPKAWQMKSLSIGSMVAGQRASTSYTLHPHALADGIRLVSPRNVPRRSRP